MPSQTWQSSGLYKYSQRLSWHVEPNSLSRQLEAKRSSRTPVLDLTIANPTEAFADAYPHLEIHDAYSQTNDFTYHPEPFGQQRTRSAIVDLYRRRGISIDPDRLALTASTSEAYSLIFQLFADPQSEILAPVPSYPLFEYLASLASVRIIPYRLLYDGAWFIDLDNLRKQINPRTRAIVIVNPNNPTGSFLKVREAEELLRIAIENQLPIISDEVFLDYSFSEPAGRIRTLIETDSVLSFSLDGLSKTCAMPQMKLGWIAINGPQEQTQQARSRLELLLDTYLSVSTPVQCAAPRLLQIGAAFQSRVVARTTDNLRRLQQILLNSPAHVLHTEGGWSAIMQLPRTVPEEVWVSRLLQEQNVLVQPGYFFDMPSEAYLVVSLITPPAAFEEGIVRLSALVSEVTDNRHEGPAA